MTKMARRGPSRGLERFLEGLRGALEAAGHGARQRLARELLDARDRVAQRNPGAMLNDSVTDGSCPMWFTDCGPTLCFVENHCRKRDQLSTRRLDIQHREGCGSCWYCGATCMITWYSSFGAKIWEICRDPYAEDSADST